MKPLRCVAYAAGLLGWVMTASGFVPQEYPKWADGVVQMHLKLGTSPYTGGVTPNSTARDAIGIWNSYMRRLQLLGVNASTGVGATSSGPAPSR
jgi:hypothetical protein